MEFFDSGGDALVQLKWQSPSMSRQIISPGALSPPLSASGEKPANGAIGVKHTPTLRWTAGDNAAYHNVYFGDDRTVVENADTTTTGVYRGQQVLGHTKYTPTEAPLEWNKNYYWRIDEVNDLHTDSLWKGKVWKFTTADYIILEDFEDYNDTEPDRIFDAWVDGWKIDENGSQVGYSTGPFAEQTIVHSGSQSMPFSYKNTGSATYSEASHTFDSAQDWTGHGITTLVMYFYGYPENVPGQLYVKINNTRVNYSGPSDALLRSRWTQWDIDLTDVSAAGNVTSLTLGIEGAGSQGLLLVDDILLYKIAPEISVVSAVDPGTDDLLAYYDMENDLLDGSGNGLNGTAIGAPTFSAGLGSFGMALDLDGADCVDLGEQAAFNPIGSFSVSLWANAETWNSDWGHAMIGNRGEDNIGWQIRRYGSSSNIAFTTRGVGNDDTQSNAVMPLGDWVHIACVYDNSANTKQIYINGALDREVTTNAGVSIAATTHNTYIGARADSGNTGQEAFFTGLLDEIRVYNKALSPGEVEFLSDPTP